MTLPMVLIVLTLFVWSFAEAFSWPVVPDAALVATVFIVPDSAPWAVAAVVLGSAAGGACGIVSYRRGRRWPLPLITDGMRSRVRQWMRQGASGLRNQPLTAVPYKVFVVEAASRGVDATAFAVLTVVFRGLRMSAAAAMALIAGRMVAEWSPAGTEPIVRSIVLLAGLVVFLVGWRAAYRIWDRSEARRPTPTGERSVHRHTMRR